MAEPAATIFAAVAGGDVARLTGSPIAAHISAAATTCPVFRFATNHRTLARERAWPWAPGPTKLAKKLEGFGAAPAPLELPATDGSEVSGQPWRAWKRSASGFVGTKSFTVGLLLVRQLCSKSARRPWEIPPRPLNATCDGVENQVRMYRGCYFTSRAGAPWRGSWS